MSLLSLALAAVTTLAPATPTPASPPPPAAPQYTADLSTSLCALRDSTVLTLQLHPEETAHYQYILERIDRRITEHIARTTLSAKRGPTVQSHCLRYTLPLRPLPQREVAKPLARSRMVGGGTAFGIGTASIAVGAIVWVTCNDTGIFACLAEGLTATGLWALGGATVVIGAVVFGIGARDFRRSDPRIRPAIKGRPLTWRLRPNLHGISFALSF